MWNARIAFIDIATKAWRAFEKIVWQSTLRWVANEVIRCGIVLDITHPLDTPSRVTCNITRVMIARETSPSVTRTLFKQFQRVSSSFFSSSCPRHILCSVDPSGLLLVYPSLLLCRIAFHRMNRAGKKTSAKFLASGAKIKCQPLNDDLVIQNSLSNSNTPYWSSQVVIANFWIICWPTRLHGSTSLHPPLTIISYHNVCQQNCIMKLNQLHVLALVE